MRLALPVRRAIPVFLVFGAALFGGPALAVGDEAPAAPGKKLFGYLDPTTNVFVPAQAAAAVAPTASEPIHVTGTLVVTVQVHLGSSVPSGSTLSASASAATVAPSTDSPGYSSLVNASGNLTQSGNTATGKLTMPYGFTVSSLTQSVTVSFQLFGANESVEQTLIIALPKSGATTVLTISESL